MDFCRLALSPCPNDTYLFHAWITGIVGKELPAQAVFADIEQLNAWALKGAFPLIKLSFSCFKKVVQNYQLLPIGAALGFYCGPKIIAKHSFPLSELHQKKIAIPGRETTAHFLLSRLQLPVKEKVFCLYHEIASLIRSERVECGLIIHESRFTFQEAGFVEIADLGEMWHEETHLPLPLGGLAVARALPDAAKQQIASILHDSLKHARLHPEMPLPFIVSHAQEKNLEVVRKHIDTYVTEETGGLSTEGIYAIETLLEDQLPKDWLYV